MALIRICDLKVRAIIGAHPWERVNKQDLMVNLTIEYDSLKASRSDRLKDALDYEALANKLVKAIEKSRFQLLEKLADVLLKAVMQDKRINTAVIRLDKPHAIGAAKGVSIELSAER